MLAGVLRSARALAPVIRRQRPLTVARHMPTTQEEIEAAKLPTNADEEMVKLRHSASHVMALAVKNVFKDEVQVTIGPWIENGYYYDFHKPTGEAITDKDLKRIKKEMDKIIKKDYPIIREVLPREEARQFLLEQGKLSKWRSWTTYRTRPRFRFIALGTSGGTCVPGRTWNLPVRSPRKP